MEAITEQSEGIRQSRLVKWSLVFGAWTLMAIVFSSPSVFDGIRLGKPTDGLLVVRAELVFCYLWFLLTPCAIWLHEYLHLDSWKLWLRISAHLLIGLVLSLLQLLLYTWITGVLGWTDAPPPFIHSYLIHVGYLLPFSLLFYWGIVIVNYAIGYYRKYQERKLRAVQLEAQLAQAQLEALKMQLHPHFLFNTLHTISAHMHTDVETAEDMIMHLSDLLRITLENIGVQEVSLKQELDLLERYLQIEQVRYGERLEVSMKVVPETLDALVPNLILQPLVENAIRHGISARARGGRIEIGAHREGGMLQIQVRDNGLGITGTRRASKDGIGLANTQERLRRMYGTRHHYSIHNTPGSGLLIRISIPFRESGTNVCRHFAS